MGKVLQIRVIAQTFRYEDIEKTWPSLWELVWPETPKGADARQGLLDFVQTLDDRRRFGPWSGEVKEGLAKNIEGCLRVKLDLEKALADWKPSEANKLSDRLEDLLHELEAKAAKFPK